MKRTLYVALVISTLSVFSAYSASADDGIYGEDDRRDVFEARSSFEATLAESTVALVHSANLKKNPDDSFSLKQDTYGVVYGLCRDERFWEQTVGAQASGSLVGEDLVLTAAHTIFDQADCRQTRVVFGYEIKDQNQKGFNFPSEDVAECKEILVRNAELDFLIFRIDRKITHRKPLAVNRGKLPMKGEEIIVIGYPSGLAAKLSPGHVIQTSEKQILADTDTYGGNSGSAVFNSKTGLIEGILTGGGSDFTTHDGENCQRSTVVKKVPCLLGRCEGGEYIAPVGLFLNHIPEL